MEPFGILRFLQALQDLAPVFKTEEGSEANPAKPSDTGEKTTKNAPQDIPSEKSPTHAQDAVLGFLEAHDARAKRTKK